MSKARNKRLMQGIEIVYEDRDIIVVDKAEGILTHSTRKGEEHTVENAINDYIRKGQSRSRKSITIIHRLDRETSGLLLLAKNEESAETLRQAWHSSVEKIYLAGATGNILPREGTLQSFLYEDKDLFVREIKEHLIKKVPEHIRNTAKHSITHYKVIAEAPKATLLKVRLQTGRRNQIRVQFAGIGHPLIGDKKYGNPPKGDKTRMLLHAHQLTFPHPYNGKMLSFTSPPPTPFNELFDLKKESTQQLNKGEQK